MSDRKRAYRYAVIDHGGTGTKAVGDSPFVLDWKYLGRTYTWNIVGGPRLESSGFITGRYLDKGWLVDGEYVADAEVAA
jgi:hypothetical protein